MAGADVDNLENSKGFQEWKECNDKIAKLDSILIDLRRYGFTVASTLMTAGSFLGLQSFTQFQPFQIVIIFATMALVDVLYWLDVYYQTILTAVVLRVQVLEKNLSLGAGIYISRFYMRHKIGKALHILYIGFLVSLAIIGAYVVYANKLDYSSHIPLHFWIFFLITPIIFVVGIWVFFDRPRYATYTKAQPIISNFLRSSGKPQSNKTLDQEILKFLDSDREDLGLDLDSNEWVHFDITGLGKTRYVFCSHRLIVTSIRIYCISSNPLWHTLKSFEYKSFQYEEEKIKNGNSIFSIFALPSLRPFGFRNDLPLPGSADFRIKISRELCTEVVRKVTEIVISSRCTEDSIRGL